MTRRWQSRQTLSRSAERSDLAAIVRLLADDPLGQQREQVAEPVPEPCTRAFETVRTSEGNEILVAVLGDEVGGCLQLIVVPVIVIPGLSPQGMTRSQIEGVRVARHVRGRGSGRGWSRWGSSTPDLPVAS